MWKVELINSWANSVFGLEKNFANRTLFNQTAFINHGNLIADAFNHFHFMGNKKNGDT